MRHQQITAMATRVFEQGLLCVVLALFCLCLASPASAQTPTYFDAPDCYGVPCQIHMEDFGGPIMTGKVDVYSIYYGDWSTHSDAVTTLSNLFTDLNGSAYLNLMTVYGASTDIDFKGNYAATSYYGNNPTDAQLGDIVTNFANSTGAEYDSNAIFFLFTAPDVRSPPDDAYNCSYHSNVGSLKFAWISGAAASPGDGCGDTFNGALTGDTSHELFETLTDPLYSEATSLGPPLGWVDEYSGNEIVDPCSGADFTGTLSNGGVFALEPVFVNNAKYAVGGYCSSGLALTAEGSSAAPEPAQWLLMAGGVALTGAALRLCRRRLDVLSDPTHFGPIGGDLR